jgi:hypothetical protein
MCKNLKKKFHKKLKKSQRIAQKNSTMFLKYYNILFLICFKLFILIKKKNNIIDHGLK